jgi:hypothetical protein
MYLEKLQQTWRRQPRPGLSPVEHETGMQAYKSSSEVATDQLYNSEQRVM